MGFNFTKISVEKLSEDFKDLKISTNVDIAEIDKVNAEFFKGKEELVGVKFSYKVEYDPLIANIEIKGAVLLALEPKQAKEVLKRWKDKQIPEDFKMFLFNFILRKSNIKAIQLEDEMNLPLHIPLPRVSKQQEQPKE